MPVPLLVLATAGRLASALGELEPESVSIIIFIPTLYHEEMNNIRLVPLLAPLLVITTVLLPGRLTLGGPLLAPEPESVAKCVMNTARLHIKKYNIPTPGLVLSLAPCHALTAVLVSGRLTIGGSLLAPCESEPAESMAKWVSEHIHMH